MRRALSLSMVALVACAAASGIMRGDTSSIVSGVAESTGTVVGLTQDLSKCDLIGAAEVTFDEERTIGGAVALELGAAGAGFWWTCPPATRLRSRIPRRSASRTRHGTSSTST